MLYVPRHLPNKLNTRCPWIFDEFAQNWWESIQ
jgi:hypothetical protein